jgi:hypothetical protein
MKKSYTVIIPIAGSISIEVEAEDKAKAIDAAWAKIDEQASDAGEVEWEFLTRIAEGNVCYAPVTNTRVEEQQ